MRPVLYRRFRDISVVRVIAKAVIPFILLFALYVQFHGDFGPGGGFQAGVIFAAGLILYGLIFGGAPLRKVFPPRAVEIGAALGVLIYGGTGLYSLFIPKEGTAGTYAFLDYGALTPHHPVHGQHYGILFVELGVGITVTCVMVAIFYAFSGRERS